MPPDAGGPPPTLPSMSTPSQPASAEPAASRLRARSAALAFELRPDAAIVFMFAASRVLILAAAAVAEYLLPRNPVLTSGSTGPVLTSLTSWDGWYYLGIAAGGYQAGPVSGEYSNVAFPPLFPLVVRLLALPAPAYQGLVAVIVSNVAFLFSLSLLARLGSPYLGHRRAVLAACLLAIYPFASVYAMAYTESLFLLLTVAGFLAAERGHRAWAGVLIALAALCRLQGVVLVLPLLVLMLRQDGWRPRRSLGWLILAPIAATGFLLYAASITGSLTAFLDAQQAWGRQGIGGSAPGETVVARFSAYQGALLLSLLWSVWLLVFVRVDRMRVEYVLVPVLFIAAELASGTLEAVGRITMGFPYVWILASRRSMFARRTWPVVSAGLFTVVAILSFGGYWVP